MELELVVCVCTTVCVYMCAGGGGVRGSGGREVVVFLFPLIMEEVACVFQQTSINTIVH